MFPYGIWYVTYDPCQLRRVPYELSISQLGLKF
nr:MAG TPA: hypothetical protein [Caudoviricetes sp.]